MIDKTFQNSVSLPDDQKQRVCSWLNARLADTLDLKMQAKHAHWNVKGRAFYALHLLFDQIAEHLEAASDLLAERITALGHVAAGTVRQVALNTALPEYP